MKHFTVLLSSLIFLQTLVMAALIFVLLRLSNSPSSISLNASTEDLANSYQPIFTRTITQAAQPATKAMLAPLFAISDENQALIWQQEGESRWLKVVAWMSETAFEQHYASSLEDKTLGTIPETLKLWVTAVPQIQNFCRQLDFTDKSFRIKQFLGLDPNRKYETFVELLVQEQDLLRPCPDPEINDQYCNLSFTFEPMPKVRNIDNYQRYFEQLIQSSYGANGAPWTRLGYTYDWAYGRRNIGASEYILVPKARYRVVGAYSTEEYCRD